MPKQLDFLTLEVGSTITKANGFMKTADNSLEHVAQGFAPTSVSKGNVGIGIFAVNTCIIFSITFLLPLFQIIIFYILH